MKQAGSVRKPVCSRLKQSDFPELATWSFTRILRSTSCEKENWWDLYVASMKWRWGWLFVQWPTTFYSSLVILVRTQLMHKFLQHPGRWEQAKSSSLSPRDHCAHNDQINELWGAFMPDWSEIGISEAGKASCCWPPCCLLLLQHRDQPGDTTAPPQFKPEIGESFENQKGTMSV